MFVTASAIVGLALAGCLAPTGATPIHDINQLGTPTIAGRNYASGTVLCYYLCPPSANGVPHDPTYDSEYVDDNDMPFGFCRYQNDEHSYNCYYTGIGGEVWFPGLISASECPDTAAEGSCGTEPVHGFKKRAAVKKRNAKQELIARLQYKAEKREGHTLPDQA